MGVSSNDYSISLGRGGDGHVHMITILHGRGGISQDPNSDNVIYGQPLNGNCISLLTTSYLCSQTVFYILIKISKPFSGKVGDALAEHRSKGGPVEKALAPACKYIFTAMKIIITNRVLNLGQSVKFLKQSTVRLNKPLLK